MPAKHYDGGVVLTGAAIDGYKALLLKHSLQLWSIGVKSHRGVKLGELLKIATEITSKPYTKNAKGIATAIADITTMFNAAGNFETMGADIREAKQRRRSSTLV
jgi:hypothetical protein